MQAVRNGVLCALSWCVLLAMAPAQQEPPKEAPKPAQGQEPQGRDAQGKEDIRTDAEGDRASRLTLKLKDRDLRDVVLSIKRKANVNIIMDPGIEAAVTIDMQDVHWRQALELVAEQAGCVVTEQGEGVLKVEKPPRVYFAFENTDIQKVIDTIAKISGANIVVAPEVKGLITVRLKNIPWRDALDAAVKTLGFVVVTEERGILRVVPAANIQQDLETATLPLRYVRPQSYYIPFITSEYVENKRGKQQLPLGKIEFTLLDTLKRMITAEVGSLEYVQEKNVIVVKDTKPVVDSIRKMVEMIDIEPAQVHLDIRFVTTSNEDVLDIGVSPGGTGWSAGLSLGQIPSGAGPWADPLLDAPAAVTIPNVVFGALNFQQVTATLRLLKKDSRSEIVQAPNITTLDNQTATIFVGEAVRYAQARVEQGQAGGLLLALEEGDESPVSIGFQLLATPHIVPGTDKVIMEVIPQRTALSGTGNTALAPAGFDVFTVGSGTDAGSGSIALPRVASSTLATTVLLRSSQTAVLGGLKTKTESDTTTQLPLLGDIPLLGYLFKEKSKQETTSTLLVFITPTILRSPEDQEQSMRKVLEERIRDHSAGLAAQREAIFGKDGK